MYTFRRACLGIFLVALVLLAAACQPGQLFGPEPTPTFTPTPDPIILAGNWKAETDFGNVKLTVQPDGRTITDVSCTFLIGNDIIMNTSFGEYEFSNFIFEWETVVGQVKQSRFSFHFEFNQDGETGTVVWEGKLPSENVGGTDEMFKTE